MKRTSSNTGGLRRFGLVVVGVMVVIISAVSPASAHEPGTSAVEVQVTASGLEVEIDLPIEELGEALGEEIPMNVLALSQIRPAIVSYINENFQISGEDALAWAADVGRLTVVRVDGRQFLRVPLDMADPMSSNGAAGADSFIIRASAIIENDDSHRIIVTLTDSEGNAAIVGIIDNGDSELPVTLTGEEGAVASAQASFGVILGYGFSHVLEGADHLLFLLTLLLPAPLVVAGRRWKSSPSFWHAAKGVVHVATAFAVGHSISLAASALGFVSAPARPIEIVIAASVGVSGLHAVRPLTTKGEVPIAAGFGLVHGLAFAEILNNLDLSGGNTLRTLLAFNLGVEAAQLVTICVAFPSIWLLSRTRTYPFARVVGGSTAVVASLVWIADRTGLGSEILAPVEEGTIANLVPLGVGFFVLAAAVWLVDRRQPGDVVLLDDGVGGERHDAGGSERPQV